MAKSERSKHIKHSEGIDRISSLPEPLLSHILSLLPTKSAVATSLLSTGWKFSWTSITNLELDFEDFRLKYPEKTLDMRVKKFTQFVNRALLLLNPLCIQNFQLKCHHELCDPFHVDSWICAAMGPTNRNLDCTSFPNLLTLHLSGIKFMIGSNCSVSFPNLKDLLLDSVRYTNEESVHKLFASCSSLENLIIKRNDQDNALSLIISIPSLISLTICFCMSNSYWQSRLQIDTPGLKYLNVEDDSMCCFTSETLPSLLEARIKIGLGLSGGSPARDEDVYSTNLFKFFGALCNVKFLSLSGHTLEVFQYQYQYQSENIAPVFHNLSRLELSDNCCWCSSVVLENFLENMDNLEHLVLKISKEYGKSNCGWMVPPTCLVDRATTISFPDLCFECSIDGGLLRYFMMNAKVLKMLTVDNRIVGTLADKLNFLYILSKTPRGSQECEVHVNVGVGIWKLSGL